ncbi:hypothetical protein D3C76_1575880 [compost metagenome]
MGGGHIDDGKGVQHTAGANVATGLAAAIRAPDQQTARGKNLKIMLSGCVAVHLLIHRRDNRDRGRCSQANGGDQVVRHSSRDARD